MLLVFNCRVLIFLWCWLIVFVGLSPFLPLSLSCDLIHLLYRPVCHWQHSQDEREREGEEGRNAETEIPFSSPIPHLFSHTVNTEDPGCRWWLHSATAVAWRRRELQLFVYKPLVLPGQCCCQMGFEQRVSVICDSTGCRFSFQPNTTAGEFSLYSAPHLVLSVLIKAAVVFDSN